MESGNPLMDYDSLLHQMAKDISEIKATLPHLVDRSVCEGRWGKLVGMAILVSASMAVLVRIIL